MPSFAKVKHMDGHIDMVVRFDSQDDRDRVISDGLHGSYSPASEQFANDFVCAHAARWVGPFEYYGGTPLDGIRWWHTIYD